MLSLIWFAVCDGADRVRAVVHCGSSCCARCSASAWAPSGRAARRSRWRTGRRAAAASPRASCRAAGPIGYLLAAPVVALRRAALRLARAVPRRRAARAARAARSASSCPRAPSGSRRRRSHASQASWSEARADARRAPAIVVGLASSMAPRLRRLLRARRQLLPLLMQAELGVHHRATCARGTSLFNVGMLIGAVVCGWVAKRRGVDRRRRRARAAHGAARCRSTSAACPDLLRSAPSSAACSASGYCGVVAAAAHRAVPGATCARAASASSTTWARCRRRSSRPCSPTWPSGHQSPWARRL